MPRRETYELASAFLQTKLWKRLFDDEIFAVKIPEGDIAYCCVMGFLGENLALAVYPGEAGLATYRMLADMPNEDAPLRRHELLHGHDCIMCSFEERGDLEERDLEDIRDCGLSLRGRRLLPMLRRYRPRCFGWYIGEDDADEALLALALRAGLDVARKVKDIMGQGKVALGFTRGYPKDREIPLLTPDGRGGFIWSRHPLPPVMQPSYPSPRLKDDLIVRRLLKTEKSGSWACGVFLSPMPTAEGGADEEGSVTEPDAVPYFPLTILVVDQADGMIRYCELASGRDEEDLALVSGFVGYMLDNKRPSELLAQDERAYALLSGLAEQADIRLSRAASLPLLEEAETSLWRAANGDQEGLMQELIERLEELVTEGDLDAQLIELLDDNALPEAMRKSLRRFLPEIAEAEGTNEAVARPKLRVMPGGPAGYVISVSLGKGCYRHIEKPASATLKELHEDIQEAFCFDNDHSYAFFMGNRAWSRENAYFSSGAADGGRSAEDVALGDLDLQQGALFKYLFDFGDEWLFQCKVLRTLDVAPGEPAVIRSVGEAPPQYGDEGCEEEDDDE